MIQSIGVGIADAELEIVEDVGNVRLVTTAAIQQSHVDDADTERKKETPPSASRRCPSGSTRRRWKISPSTHAM
jgi:hypothetical protein